MTEQTTPLRQRMIEDMTIRNMSPSTQKIYVRAVANFSIFHGRSPDKLTFEDVRNYRLHLISRRFKATTINPIMGALRFFYGTTLGQKQVSEQIPYARRADTLPAVLARDEVVRFLKAGRTKSFGDFKTVKDKIALLNIGAYHSVDVRSFASLLALPSSRVSLGWAQDVLFPDAEAGKRIVICMRSAAYWGLEQG